MAASLGTLTVFGPVELTATWRGLAESPQFALTVGHVFWRGRSRSAGQE
jgi:hypothetical protein